MLIKLELFSFLYFLYGGDNNDHNYHKFVAIHLCTSCEYLSSLIEIYRYCKRILHRQLIIDVGY